MASCPIISWQIDGEKVETVTDFIFLGSKITVDSDCSHEFKRCLLLEGKAMTNLDSILKSRDIALPTNVCLVKAMVFPVVTYGCEIWTIKKPEHQRIDALKMWCWISRLLPCPGYYEQCCDEHWGTRVCFPSGFLSVYAQQWDCWILRQFFAIPSSRGSSQPSD